MTELTDDFRGNNKTLFECIKALIELSDAGALVPHGLGGHARRADQGSLSQNPLLQRAYIMSEKDIVTRLRNYATCTDSDVDEAADTIERLRDERDEFRYSADDAVKELLEAEEALARALTRAAEMREACAKAAEEYYADHPYRLAGEMIARVIRMVKTA